MTRQGPGRDRPAVYPRAGDGTGNVRSSLSAVAGPRTPGMFSRTLAQHYERLAAAHPHREALVVAESDRRLTFAGLHKAALATARSLRSHGFGPGDTLAVSAPHSPHPPGPVKEYGLWREAKSFPRDTPGTRILQCVD